MVLNGHGNARRLPSNIMYEEHELFFFMLSKIESLVPIKNITRTIIMEQIYGNLNVEFVNNKFYFSGHSAEMLVPITIEKDSKYYVSFTPNKPTFIHDQSGKLLATQHQINKDKTIFVVNNVVYIVKILEVDNDSFTFVLKSKTMPTNKWSPISQHVCVDDAFANGKHHHFVKKFNNSKIRVLDFSSLMGALISGQLSQLQ